MEGTAPRRAIAARYARATQPIWRAPRTDPRLARPRLRSRGAPQPCPTPRPPCTPPSWRRSRTTPRVRADEVAVETLGDRGRIVLRGTVGGLVQQAEAVRTASGVPGVRHV